MTDSTQQAIRVDSIGVRARRDLTPQGIIVWQ
jgi:hypothetical protein